MYAGHSLSILLNISLKGIWIGNRRGKDEREEEREKKRREEKKREEKKGEEERRGHLKSKTTVSKKTKKHL